MEYTHINDCWNALREAKSVEEVEELFMSFPRWSGEWSWYESSDNYVVVVNDYFDSCLDSYETDRETLDIKAVEA